jgi:hypothetical protein
MVRKVETLATCPLKQLRINTIRSVEMTKRLELIGKTFGRWTVIADAGNKKQASFWYCECDCGTVRTIQGDSLTGGNSKSCGCLNVDNVTTRSTKHGHLKGRVKSKTYNSWTQMKSRCLNPNNPQYKDYGGRGIKICDRWLNSFENFFEDMGKCPEDLTLDRKDNNGNYTPENCRWATRSEQNNNARTNKPIKYKGVTKNLSQWARELNMLVCTLARRFNEYHWDTEKAFNTPLKTCGGPKR